MRKRRSAYALVLAQLPELMELPSVQCTRSVYRHSSIEASWNTKCRNKKQYVHARACADIGIYARVFRKAPYHVRSGQRSQNVSFLSRVKRCCCGCFFIGQKCKQCVCHLTVVGSDIVITYTLELVTVPKAVTHTLFEAKKRTKRRINPRYLDA